MRARRGPNEPLREAAHAPETTMPACAGIEILAERGGFEPPKGYSPLHAFQACDLNRSSISPGSPTS